MADNAHLLIVEDDEFVQSLLAAYLKKSGHRVTTAGSAAEMFVALDHENISLILLDLGLPDEDGIALVRQLRTRLQTPIIVLTARQGRDDKISALEVGADDFLTKPVDPEELSLRDDNMLRRLSNSGGMQRVSDDLEKLLFAGWSLDIAADILRSPDGEEVKLTRAEFDLLTVLARAQNRVLSRAYLLDAVSRDSNEAGDRVIDVLISRIRKKIETNSRKPQIIHTVAGRGYRLTS
ncbi:MAG: response regulator transcription factor [Proteobacteria bacterium]|nr:response regulator transcription factor [Pseudomonadota bacterium]